MTLKAFKACFEVLFRLNDNLKADYKFTIGDKEKNLLFSLMFFLLTISTSLLSKKNSIIK